MRLPFSRTVTAVRRRFLPCDCSVWLTRNHCGQCCSDRLRCARMAASATRLRDRQLAACKDTSNHRLGTKHAAVRVSFNSLMVQRDQWDKYWAAKKLISKFAVLRPTSHKAAVPVESCQSLPKRCPWGRLGSVLYTCTRLHRIRRRFKHFWPISLSRPLGLAIFWPCAANAFSGRRTRAAAGTLN